jgi:hypothetical protein
MMSNPHKGDVPFEVAGKQYVLRYSHRALVLLEERTGKSLMQIIKEIDGWRTAPENMKLGTVCTLLWAGLQKHQPEMTVDDATDLLDDVDGGVPQIIELLGTSLQRAFSAPGTKGTNPPTKAENGAGMSSTSSMPASDIGRMTSGRSLQES